MQKLGMKVTVTLANEKTVTFHNVTGIEYNCNNAEKIEDRRIAILSDIHGAGWVLDFVEIKKFAVENEEYFNTTFEVR